MPRAITEMTEAELESTLGLSDGGFGALETGKGLLPLESMAVAAKLTEHGAQIEIKQRFVNTLDEPLEATYIFPLPDRAAVTMFHLQVGERKVEGVIQERGEARRAYDDALLQGHRAAITEEDRSGVFSLRVGNLMPNDIAEIRFSLVGPLPVEDGDATFRFPLVVAPRYIPGTPLRGESVGDGIAPDTDQVPDASRISPPVLLPGFPNPVRLSLTVDLDPGSVPVAEVRSSLHSVVEESRPDGGMRIALRAGERLNRDFVLRYRLGDQGMRAALRLAADQDQASDGNDGTFSLTLTPPEEQGSQRPREVVFVLDRSGSMSGWKMVAARRAVGRMIDTLSAADRFSVIAFDNAIEEPPGAIGLRTGIDRNRFRCIEWLGRIDSRGGTEMLQPLTRAVGLLSASEGDSDRTLILITDGQVGDEDHILRSLAPDLERVRVHTLGIDQAVNAGFLQRLAAAGGGSASFVESEDRLDEVIDTIHRKIAVPVATEITLVGDGIELDRESISPARAPDLFYGCPTVIRGRYRGKSGAVQVQGATYDGESLRFSVAGSPGDRAIDRPLWARARVRQLEDEYAMGRGGQGKLTEDIVNTSVEFHVLSRFTAFVAIDRGEVVNAEGEGRTIVQPVELPGGWESGGLAEATIAPAASYDAMAPRMMYSLAMPAPASSPPPSPPSSPMLRKSLRMRAEIAESSGGEGLSVDRYRVRLRDIAYRANAAPLSLQTAQSLCRELRTLVSDLSGMGAEADALLQQLRDLATELNSALQKPAGVDIALQRALDQLEALLLSMGERPRAFWK